MTADEIVRYLNDLHIAKVRFQAWAWYMMRGKQG